MLSIPPSTKIFIVVGSTDLRKQYDSLAAIVSGTLKLDPYSGHLFVFANRKRDRLRILFFDRSGFCLFSKRLERGTFAWPDSSGETIELTSEELAVLLAGIDLRGARRRRWYERECADG